MREIKFRAWDDRKKEYATSNGNAIYFPYTNNLDRSKFILQEGESYDELNKLLSYWKWLQYTGLKDKNGVEIYEGDIVTFNHKEQPEWGTITRVINWNSAALTPNGFPEWYKLQNIEVIGNLYENPELLKNDR